MLEYFANCRNGIIKKIDEALAFFEQETDPMLSWPDFSKKIRAYMLGGKMIRGALVRLGADVCRPLAPNGSRSLSETGRSALASDYDMALDWMGAAMEFFQAGLLIHDDIMDRDTVRRGAATVHWQYRMEAAKLCENGSEHSDPAGNELLHYGESQGICAGDIAFFLGNFCLVRSGSGLLDFPNMELCKVGLAQMLDVRFGTAEFRAEPSCEEIITIYRYKTGRYTFSLPLGLGARFAGVDGEVLSRIERYGECLGIVFQLKDDELGIWASEAALGKSSGIDIRENKKTLHRRLFLDTLRQGQHQNESQLVSCFGNKDLTAGELEEIRDAMEAQGVRKRVELVMRQYIDEARTLRSGFPFFNTEALDALAELEQYSLDRGY